MSNDGFTLDGASQSTCEEDETGEEGEWSDPTPECVQDTIQGIACFCTIVINCT